MSKETSDSVSEVPTLKIKCPLPNNIDLYNNEEYAPDVDFAIAGLKEPLHLHRCLLMRASNVLFAMFLAKLNACGKFDAESHHVEWMFTEGETDAMYLTTLGKWLRFCYGEDQVFLVSECSSALTTLFQLQLKCQSSVLNDFKASLIEIAKKNLTEACKLLLDLTAMYEDCKLSEFDILNHELAKSVFKNVNIVNKPEIVLDRCLFKLPISYLDDVEYSEPHSKSSEFHVKMQFMMKHEPPLPIELKREVLKHCDVRDLGSSEISMLRSSKILEQDALMDLLLRALASKEEENVELRKNKKSVKTGTVSTCISTGHSDANAGGAIIDDARHVIISVSNDCNKCRDVFVTRLDDDMHGKTEKKTELIPFRTTDHAPVYDGTKYVYFMEQANRFGRVDIDTLQFEELPSLPDKAFAVIFSGCFHNGDFFAVDKGAQLCRFSFSAQAWTRVGIKVPAHPENTGVRLMNDPQDEDHIYMMAYHDKSGLYRIDLNSKEVDVISYPPAPYNMPREALLLRFNPEEFIIIAALKDGEWYRYSSKANEWTPLPEWRPFKGKYNHNYLVYSPLYQTFYCHIEGSERWECTQLLKQ